MVIVMSNEVKHFFLYLIVVLANCIAFPGEAQLL